MRARPRRTILLAAVIVPIALAGTPGTSRADGGAGEGTPGPVLFVRQEDELGGPFPKRLWTLAPGSPAVVVPNTLGAWDGRWSPDGRVIAYTTWNNGIFLVNPDGSGLRQLFVPGEGERFGTPHWSPDGTRLAYTTHTNGANLHIEIADSIDGTRESLSTDLTEISEWAADGSFWGTVVRNWRDPATGDYHHAEELAVMEAGGGTRELTATPDLHEGVPRVSPDGSQVAFLGYVAATGAYRIEVMNVDGSGRRKVVAVPAASWPTWSPDGTRLLYLAGWRPTSPTRRKASTGPPCRAPWRHRHHGRRPRRRKVRWHPGRSRPRPTPGSARLPCRIPRCGRPGRLPRRASGRTGMGIATRSRSSSA
jgi:hypothetical protein